jgi:CubicO group peptidase (beta-lactamase class C family)
MKVAAWMCIAYSIAASNSAVSWGAIVASLGFFCGSALATEAPAVDGKSVTLKEQLELIRQKYKLPALAAAVVTSQGLVTLEAVGVRKAGTEIDVTADDLWHLGSDTKAMTAFIIGSLVEKGRLRWDETIEEVFPDQAAQFTPEFRKITLLELLSHHTGLPPNLDWGAMNGAGVNVISQRRMAIRAAGKLKLQSTPGTQYAYANTNYVLAGAIAEKVTGESWEDLMKETLFTPLGMASAGFGGTGTLGKIDQPWPHGGDGKPMDKNGPQQDNLPVMGPAGRVHCSMADWAKYIADQLRGLTGQKALLSAKTYEKLFEPQFEGTYTLGWLAVTRSWAGGTAYTHSGSNTMNYCTVWLAPKKDFAVLVATNTAIPDAGQACDDACAYLIGTYLTKAKPQDR